MEKGTKDRLAKEVLSRNTRFTPKFTLPLSNISCVNEQAALSDDSLNWPDENVCIPHMHPWREISLQLEQLRSLKSFSQLAFGHPVEIEGIWYNNSSY